MIGIVTYVFVAISALIKAVSLFSINDGSTILFAVAELIFRKFFYLPPIF